MSAGIHGEFRRGTVPLTEPAPCVTSGSSPTYGSFRTEPLTWNELPDGFPAPHARQSRLKRHSTAESATGSASERITDAVPGRLAALGRACHRHRRWVL